MLGHPLRLLATLLAGLLIAFTLGPLAPPRAAAAGEPTLTLSAPATARIGRAVKVTATLAGDGTQPTAGETVQFQRLGTDGTWTTLPAAVTTADPGDVPPGPLRQERQTLPEPTTCSR